MHHEPILITCQNRACAYFMTEPGKKLLRNGRNSAGNQRYHCLHCDTFFVETKNTPLYRSRLSRFQVEFLAKISVEKTSIRAVSRIININRGTISRYNLLFGEHAAFLNESHTVNISPGECEMDEVWSYNYKKEKNVKLGDPPEYGDCWLFTAVKRLSAFLVSFACGKRTEPTCRKMLEKLFVAMDLPFPGRKTFFSTDGNPQYEELLKEFYSETCIGYGQIIKEKKGNSVIKIRFKSIFGNMTGHKISTSVVEGYNNKIRQRISCFVRKTAAFSKSLKSHIAKINIFIFANNFIERKTEWNGLEEMKTRTPAMIEGITDHVWTWRDFLTCNAAKGIEI
jgi:IS1 family transposase/transposase-like protein